VAGGGAGPLCKTTNHSRSNGTATAAQTSLHHHERRCHCCFAAFYCRHFRKPCRSRCLNVFLSLRFVLLVALGGAASTSVEEAIQASLFASFAV
jgi:hypothetical protein